MAGNENLAISEISLSSKDDPGHEEVDIGFRDLQAHGVPNVYVGKRNFIHQLMDVALLMANVSQLKALLSLDTDDKYYIPLFVFISMSIFLQVIFTISMLVIWSIEKKLEEHSSEVPPKVYPDDHKKKVIAERLDKMGNILVLMIIVSNVFITGLGVEPHSINASASETVVPKPENLASIVQNNTLRISEIPAEQGLAVYSRSLMGFLTAYATTVITANCKVVNRCNEGAPSKNVCSRRRISVIPFIPASSIVSMKLVDIHVTCTR